MKRDESGVKKREGEVRFYDPYVLGKNDFKEEVRNETHESREMDGGGTGVGFVLFFQKDRT